MPLGIERFLVEFSELSDFFGSLLVKHFDLAELDREGRSRRDTAIAEGFPILRSHSPSILGTLIEDPLTFDRLGVFESPFRTCLVKVKWRLSADLHACINQVVTMIEPESTDEPIVGLSEWSSRFGAIDGDVLIHQ